jgi:hypothetical protein
MLKDFSADATVVGIVNNIHKHLEISHKVCSLLKYLATLKVSVLLFQTLFYVLMVNVAFLLQNLHN